MELGSGDSLRLFESKLCEYEQVLQDGTLSEGTTRVVLTGTQWEQVLDLLEHATTRQAVLLTKGGSIQDIQDNTLQLMSVSILVIRNMMNKAAQAGHTLKVILTRSTTLLIQTLKAIIQEQQDRREQENTLSIQQAAGVVWKLCAQFKNLPKDDLDAVTHKLLQVLVLCKDAINEFDAEFKSTDDTAPRETGPIRVMITEAHTYVKHSYRFLLKSRKFNDDKKIPSAEWLEECLSLADSVSQQVDEVVSSLYDIDEDRDAVIDAAISLREAIVIFVTTMDKDTFLAEEMNKCPENQHHWIEKISMNLEVQIEQIKQLH